MSAKSPMFFTPSGPNNKKVDALRIQPRVEMHRSSSGRNLRLKHITQPRKDALLSPNALTPRAPSEKRPQERVCSFDDSRASTVSSYSSSVSSIEEDAAIVSLVSLSPIESARHPQRSRRKSNQENHDDNKLQKSQHERRCSFSISQQPDDHPEDEHEGNQIANPPNPFQVMQQQLDEDSQKQRYGVYQFDLWKKAGRSRALPDAISHAATPQAVSPSHMHMPEKRRSESIDLVPHIERIHAKELTPARASTGSSQTSVINKEPISLTRSTSPTIGSRSHRSASTSSSRKLAPLMPSAEDRTIVRWKRGELIGEGTFGKVYMGLNSDTGGLFALKEIEIRSCPNADQMRQLQKLGEEISLMRNLSHKHIVRYKGSHRTDKFFYIFMEYVPGGSIAR
ncbi:TPA: hypothetical protein N0F65_002145 [Lagenidium giganteum]|uniref:Protein kinase domain-containing protein n=1 Tax=Lagenidium giganteum TaxID=4803 RepID=A0AAV2YMY1_9STRA|nr:TPA: hypothetical protein N0F65_002145 [Lagenidium giganteum]